MIVNESSFMLVLYRLLYALGTSRGFKRAPIIVMASVSYSISLILNFPPKCSHRLRQFREIADPADAASVRTKLPRKLHAMASRLDLLLIAVVATELVTIIALVIYEAAMNENYLAMAILMAIGIVVIGLVGACAYTQDTGDEPIPQMTPGPAGDSIV